MKDLMILQVRCKMLRLMKILIQIVFLFVCFGNILAQGSFTYIISTENSERGYSCFLINDYNYVVGYQNMSAYICRFSGENDLVEKVICKPDTVGIVWYGVEKDNGNILTIGRIIADEKYYLYSCILTPDLEIVEERYMDIVPEGYDKLYLYDMAKNENGEIVFAGHLETPEPGNVNQLLLLKIDQNGNLIDQVSHVSVWYTGEHDADLIRKNDQSGYYYFGGGSMQWLDINNQLAIVDSGMWYPNLMGLPVSAKYLNNGDLAMVSCMSNLTYFYDLHIGVYTPDFEVVKETVIEETGRQSPAIYKGIDYYDPENVWVFSHNDNTGYYGIEDYRIYLLDSQLNIKGSKFISGDGDYTFYYLKATHDGGCVITGSIKQTEANKSDIIIIKVMPEDILTGVSDDIQNVVKDVLIYPNPFKDKVFTNTNSDGLTFSLHNLKGEVVLQSPIPAHQQGIINTTGMLPGVYIYSITNDKGVVIDEGKMIK
ncbi:MAG: T9SS type A sorting domain-containing protein [Clostridia bacterium]|nr:T9SS type A sorting domain-containing protein [Clostridia bacterium]